MEVIDVATLSDVPELALLLGILFTQEADFQPSIEKQKRGLEMIIETANTGVVFTARDDGVIVGMVILLFTISTAEGERVCWVEDMVVHPAHRGTGIGSSLLNSAIEYAQKHRFKRLTLLTDRLNASAIRFYNRHGFKESEMTVMRHSLQ